MITDLVKPRIELKALKVAAFLSEETMAYTAKLYVDGLYYADVSNDGHGGPDSVRLRGGRTWEEFRELDKRVEATYPTHTMDAASGPILLTESIETLCQRMAQDHDNQQRLKRKLGRQVLLLDLGKWYAMTPRQKGKDALVHLIAKAKEKYPDATILNSLSFKEAWTVYKGEAQ